MKYLHAAEQGGDPADDCGGILAGDAADNNVMIDGMDDGVDVGREIWLGEHDQDHHHHVQEDDDLLIQDPSVFYGDLPSLPEFPCMSSSSSSSTSPSPVNAILSSASSSSSSASWAILKSGSEDLQNKSHNPYEDSSADVSAGAEKMEIPAQNQGVVDVECTVDMMETFECMDLVDSNDFFDTSAIFNNDDATPTLSPLGNPSLIDQEALQNRESDVPFHRLEDQHTIEQDKEDLATVFLKWLKSNKETVSADDLRKVKIKKATIESAARRLGGGKKAMKQLLKLILEWVQTNHLHKRHNNMDYTDLPAHETQTQTQTQTQTLYHDQYYRQNPYPDVIPPTPDSTPSFSNHQSPWNPPPNPGFGFMPSPAFPGGAAPPSYLPPPPQPQPENRHLLESPASWAAPLPPLPPHQFGMANAQYCPFPYLGFTGYTANTYAYPYMPGRMGDQRFPRLCSSATKEARKKRMARQRKFLSHHNRHRNATNADSLSQQNMNQNQIGEHAIARDTFTAVQAAGAVAPPDTAGGWMYWPNVWETVESQLMQPRQGWKQEKSLRFLLQKVLKQSDVGNLGRIVLPKVKKKNTFRVLSWYVFPSIRSVCMCWDLYVKTERSRDSLTGVRDKRRHLSCHGRHRNLSCLEHALQQ
ncbi:PREDICTED: B3 domain-containing transcription factor ABI3-like isoform X2 [Tarenaya hassleriana]|uniref:B3 domain-containing transcription factor ABI3-like isoform X2 n=1 Tax=Tarenaya hassleriana TaxID=28532 RepID=UPI00053C682C|nr:PREDICTED: B3 domain-containing transcription factor ABI3-like isoform X2 [Tarenaya hassleriana]